ncbi:hypothetical protein DBR42_00770 [Pelomonas sp. HMWF004]|nr:hypothetical protein DBR42_00770 [Pelomonas sp. HMWF004]
MKRLLGVRLATAAFKLIGSVSPATPPMSSFLLKWFANGVIAFVMASTLWLAQSLSVDGQGPDLMVAQAAAPADAASAPVSARR